MTMRAGRRLRPSCVAALDGLTAELMIALDRQADQAARHPDHEMTIVMVGDFLAAMNDELARFATIRRAALNSLRDAGMSYDRIAARTGISKSRVAQLATPSRTARGSTSSACDSS